VACGRRSTTNVIRARDDCERLGCAQYQRSLEALQVLSASADAKGRPLEVIKLPLPPVLHFTEEEARGVKARPRPARPEAGQ